MWLGANYTVAVRVDDVEKIILRKVAGQLAQMVQCRLSTLPISKLNAADYAAVVYILHTHIYGARARQTDSACRLVFIVV